MDAWELEWADIRRAALELVLGAKEEVVGNRDCAPA